jgi:hypothetical protein
MTAALNVSNRKRRGQKQYEEEAISNEITTATFTSTAKGNDQQKCGKGIASGITSSMQNKDNR